MFGELVPLESNDNLKSCTLCIQYDNYIDNLLQDFKEQLDLKEIFINVMNTCITKGDSYLQTSMVIPIISERLFYVYNFVLNIFPP